MGLPSATADHATYFIGAPDKGVFYRCGPGIIDRINQICKIRHAARASFGLVLQVPLEAASSKVKGTLIWASELQLRRPFVFSRRTITSVSKPSPQNTLLSITPQVITDLRTGLNSSPFNSGSYGAVESLVSLTKRIPHLRLPDNLRAHLCRHANLTRLVLF